MPSHATVRVLPSRFRLRPYIAFHEHDGRAYLAGDTRCDLGPATPALRTAMALLQRPDGCTAGELSARLGPVATAVLMRALARLSLLQETGAGGAAGEGYLESALPVRPGAPDPLRAHGVVVVGCGGVGGEIARHLAASGIGWLALVDHDVVQLRNLNRQYLFGVDCIRRPKVEAARDALRRMAPEVRVTAVQRRIVRADDLHALGLPAPSAVVCCADEPKRVVDEATSRYAWDRGAIFTIASVGVLRGSWGPVVCPGDPLPYHEWRDGTEAMAEALDVRPTRVSFGPTNSLIAAAAARDLVHVLMGDVAPSRGAQVTLDFGTLATERIALADAPAR